MKDGPDIALIGALIGDPARANMLTALMSGKALTASELAVEAGVTLPTVSAHLKRLEDGGLILQRKQGRHRYFALASADVGSVLEAIMGLAASSGHTRVRTGPRDLAMRKARVCYNHLAGELAVEMFDRLRAVAAVDGDAEGLLLTEAGVGFFSRAGIDVAALSAGRRPLCRACLDWSARRSHLAGALGRAVLDHVFAEGWARRLEGSRAVVFTPAGERHFRKRFIA